MQVPVRAVGVSVRWVSFLHTCAPPPTNPITGTTTIHYPQPFLLCRTKRGRGRDNGQGRFTSTCADIHKIEDRQFGPRAGAS